MWSVIAVGSPLLSAPAQIRTCGIPDLGCLTAKRWLDLLELGSHAVAAGPPFDQEAAPTALAADEGEAQEVEGLALRPDFNGDIALVACFASSWTPAMVRRWHADPFGFLRPWNECASRHAPLVRHRRRHLLG